jgi:drug/metabolite transporter (DMT)-like permease
MVWAVVLGFLVFSELPDMWVAVGSAVIVGSGLFILWREKVVKGEPPAPV